MADKKEDKHYATSYWSPEGGYKSFTPTARSKCSKKVGIGP